MMFEVSFRNVGPERRCWAAYLEGVCNSAWVRHLEKRGLFLDWDVAFGQPWPLDDESGGVAGCLSHNGQSYGTYRAIPLTKEQAVAVKFLPTHDLSDSHLCEETPEVAVGMEADCVSSEIPF